MTDRRTTTRHRAAALAAGALALLAAAAPAAAQSDAAERDTAISAGGVRASAVAGPHYDVGAVDEVLLGRNWRPLWTTPVDVPVLDIGRVAGGLEPFKQGGRQSRTLHFRGEDGHRYIFRSVDKFLHAEALPPAVQYTAAGDLIQDQISMLLPAVGLVMAPLQEAAGLLHSASTLVVMPDDPRLGEYRETFAGMLGQFEENPDEGVDDTPGFAGSSKIVGTGKFLERLDRAPKHRLHSREYLAARLLDFLVGDTDRGGDQWKFARFREGDTRLWRPVPRDHDFAFLKADGAFGFVATRVYAKISSFGPRFESMRTLMFMTTDMDRRFLADIERPVWDSVVTALQTALTDDVLAAALARLPAEYRPYATPRLLPALTARRDRLHEIAADFYAAVAREADLYGTNEPERAVIERFPDGSVEVRLYADADEEVADGAEGGEDAYLRRRFLPGETREIRLHLQDGDDHVLVRGAAERSILVRVVGGDGDDVMVDSSRVAAGGVHTVFYDADGLEVVAGANTRVDRRPFERGPLGRPEDLQDEAAEEEDGDDEDAADDDDAQPELADERVGQKLSGARYRDWGRRSRWRPAVDHRSGAGILLGAGHTVTRYGFRREPYAYRAAIDALYAPETGRFGLELDGDYRTVNSPLGFSLSAAATQLESFRFYGYGNDTPLPDTASPRVHRDELALRPSVYWAFPRARIALGPVLRYGTPHHDDAGPLALERPVGASSFGQAGGRIDGMLQLGGAPLGAAAAGDPPILVLEAGGSAYPAVWDVATAFGSVHARSRAYVPVPGPGSPFIAMRAGAQKLWGGFPVHEAAFIGGRHTLRGYEGERFAGDAALYGGLELHAPLPMIELLVRGRLTAFGLLDAGRVFVDGESPGGWHTAAGGGLRFSTLGTAVSVAWARGEIGRLYFTLGLPF